jgi:hypothetical protein
MLICGIGPQGPFHVALIASQYDLLWLEADGALFAPQGRFQPRSMNHLSSARKQYLDCNE